MCRFQCVDGGTLFASLGSDPAEAGGDERANKIRRRCGNGLEEEYPAIRAHALTYCALLAQIHWLDEMGPVPDDQAGRSYGRRGKTPVVLGLGQPSAAT